MVSQNIQILYVIRIHAAFEDPLIVNITICWFQNWFWFWLYIPSKLSWSRSFDTLIHLGGASLYFPTPNFSHCSRYLSVWSQSYCLSPSVHTQHSTWAHEGGRGEGGGEIVNKRKGPRAGTPKALQNMFNVPQRRILNRDRITLFC